MVKRSGVSPDFESEIIAFDVVEPKDFIVGGDVLLSIELWDDSAWSDDLLASVQVSALRCKKRVSRSDPYTDTQQKGAKI